MKISEVTTDDIAEYIRLDEPTSTEIKEIERMRESAICYICAYTGLSYEEINEKEDITQAFYVLIADMFDNRNLYIQGKESDINKSVECILAMHSVNLL